MRHTPGPDRLAGDLPRRSRATGRAARARGLLAGTGLCLAAGLVLPAWPASAQTRTASHTAAVTVLARSKLVLSTGSLVFPSADPDAVPEVPASGGPITIAVRASVPSGGLVSLTVMATGDLRSGLDSIPASALHWTSSGPGFGAAGTVSASAQQSVGSWSGSGAWTGLQTYMLTNSWSHPTGTYTTTLTYTLTTP